MIKKYFADNRQLINRLTESYKEGDLILTPSKKLAHLIVRFYRNLMIQKGKSGWEIPKVYSLASWLQELSLMRDVPLVAPSYYRWKLFGDIFSDFRPPEPLRTSVKLARSLDASLSTLIRHKIDWNKTENESELYSWRNQVFTCFLNSIHSENMIHQEELPFFVKMSDGLDRYLPKRLHLVLLDTLSPSEQELLSYVTEKVETVSWEIHEHEKATGVEWIAFGDAEEEARWVLSDILEASERYPLHTLGIVMMDPAYQVPVFRKYLEEIIGRGVIENSGAYNIAYPGYLSETALFKASVLPLRFWLEEEDRSILISIFLSTYYGLWQGKRDEISLIDLDLRARNVHRYVFDFFSSISSEEAYAQYVLPDLWTKHFERIKGFRGNCEEWFRLLDELWNATGFPVTSDDIDEVSWRHYSELRLDLIQNLGDAKFSLEEFYTWLTAAASETQVSQVGYEEAGIQLLGPLDVRGLCFEKIWLVGLTANSFPQPPRDIPLVSPSEAKYVQGCNPESQWYFAKKLFPKILASAPEVVITRHSMMNSEIVPVSPFWKGEEKKCQYNLWEDNTGWWVRSDLFRQALTGAMSPSEWVFPENRLNEIIKLEELSVSALETILSCPFKFLVENIFGIKAIEEETIGIPPLERGLLLHRVVEKFVKRVINENIPLESDRARELLIKVSEETIAGRSASPFYQLELRRWTEAEKGLLMKWLELERERFSQGYTWKFAEIPFSGLKLGEISLRGRIDRIDVKKDDQALVCLEYKTGMLPSARSVFEYMTRPQLPCYLLAIKDGLIKRPVSIEVDELKFTGITGGYVSLKKAGDVEIKEYVPRNESWENFFGRWKKWVAKRVEPVLNSEYAADPVPGPEQSNSSPCGFCKYNLICNRFYLREVSEQ